MDFADCLAVPALIVCTIGFAGCNDRIPSPATPSQQGVSAPTTPTLPSDPNAISIRLNQVVTGVLRGSGHWCAAFDPLDTSGYPCQTYTVAVPARGTVQLDLSWSEADRIMCLLSSAGPTSGVCRNSAPTVGHYTVSAAAAPFAFAVSFEGAGPNQVLPPDAIVNYTVVASFTPADATGLSR